MNQLDFDENMISPITQVTQAGSNGNLNVQTLIEQSKKSVA